MIHLRKFQDKWLINVKLPKYLQRLIDYYDDINDANEWRIKAEEWHDNKNVDEHELLLLADKRDKLVKSALAEYDRIQKCFDEIGVPRWKATELTEEMMNDIRGLKQIEGV